MRQFIIQRQNGDRFYSHDYDIVVEKFIVPAPEHRFVREEVAGMSGAVYSKDSTDRDAVQIQFYSLARELKDFTLLRSEIFRMIRSDDWIYLIDSYSPGLRWKVYAEPHIPEWDQAYGYHTVRFKLLSPYAESVASSQDDIDMETEFWQFGQNIDTETVNDYDYTHTSNEFTIMNYGDVKIDPRNVMTELAITYQGASEDLTIKNLTTGDEWIYTGSTGASDTLRLEGVRATVNSFSIVGSTNFGVITLDPGENEFEVTGTDGAFEMKFDMRFYYL